MLISHIMIRYLVHEMEADEGTDSSHELSRYKRKRLDYQKAEKYLLLHEASLENAIEEERSDPADQPTTVEQDATSLPMDHNQGFNLQVRSQLNSQS